ncbi:DUF6932 family protein [Streptomyces europaeiscabiei]|uniref:DUF6932 family protein n=1 Tax=Streptomyces europaeiscabiei TaxID=146819 RepID=UPI0039779C76
MTGLLPPGRYAASLDELYTTLVGSTDSAIRREIWEEWSWHRTSVEAQVGEITRMWVGGSFVSTKPDPSDIDVTYLVSDHIYDALDRETLAVLHEFTDAVWCKEQNMRVDALLLRLPKKLPVSQMAPSLLDPETSESFRDLGLCDEVCQAIKPPLVHSVPGELRRGYVEVLL